MSLPKILTTLPDEAVYAFIDSPLGKLTLIASHTSLLSVLWHNEADMQLLATSLSHAPQSPIIVKTKQQLQEYFQGQRQQFSIPLSMLGTTFQKQTWQQLLKIPYGETMSYAAQAKRLGDKNKARAVGMANGRNPIPIIVPCHRVIGGNGSLSGFSGGLDKKAWLLAHEKNH